MIRTSGLLNVIVLVSVVLSSYVTIDASPHQQWISAQEHIAKGKEALAKGDDATAYWEIESARIQEPTLSEPYLLFAQLRQKQGRVEDAIAKLETGVSVNPDSADLHYALAKFLLRTGLTSRATAEAETAYKLGERSGGIFILLGDTKLPGRPTEDVPSSKEARLEWTENGYSNALAVYKEALEILPSSDEKIPELRQRIAIVSALRTNIRNQSDPTYKSAVPVSYPRPDYTDEARAHKIHGAITIAVVISEAGTVTDVVTLTGLGYGLDEAAMDAARKTEFSPAMKNGKAISSCTLMRISFQLL